MEKVRRMMRRMKKRKKKKFLTRENAWMIHSDLDHIIIRGDLLLRSV